MVVTEVNITLLNQPSQCSRYITDTAPSTKALFRLLPISFFLPCLSTVSMSPCLSTVVCACNEHDTLVIRQCGGRLSEKRLLFTGFSSGQQIRIAMPSQPATNLQEQLTWLSRYHKEAIMNGFSFAPAASAHLLGTITPAATFEFPVSFHSSSAISSLSSAGATELASFRRNDLDQSVSFNQTKPACPTTTNAVDLELDTDIPDSALLEMDLDGKVIERNFLQVY